MLDYPECYGRGSTHRLSAKRHTFQGKVVQVALVKCVPFPMLEFERKQVVRLFTSGASDSDTSQPHIIFGFKIPIVVVRKKEHDLTQQCENQTTGGIMKISTIAVVSSAVCMALASGIAAGNPADKVAPIGKTEFRNSCALCHGMDGKGGGVADLLKQAPPDLSTLSKRNGGKFPADRVAMMIDGREMVRAHGDRDMPAWGNRYSTDKVKAAEYYGDLPYKDTEMFVKSRISALMDFLKAIQVK